MKVKTKMSKTSKMPLTVRIPKLFRRESKIQKMTMLFSGILSNKDESPCILTIKFKMMIWPQIPNPLSTSPCILIEVIKLNKEPMKNQEEKLSKSI